MVLDLGDCSQPGAAWLEAWQSGQHRAPVCWPLRPAGGSVARQSSGSGGSTAFEPVMAAAGFDFYRDGAHLATANLLHAVWPTFSASSFAALQEAFVELCRSRSVESVAPFYDAVARLKSACGGEPTWIYEALDASRHIGIRQIITRSPDEVGRHLDPAATALMALVHEWSPELNAIEVHHDKSVEIERSLGLLALFWDQRAERLELTTWNGRPLIYPAPVSRLTLVESHHSPTVQVADTVAGALAHVMRAVVESNRGDAFTSALLGTPILDWVVGASVWPTMAITPEELGAAEGASPHLPDKMAAWLARAADVELGTEPT